MTAFSRFFHREVGDIGLNEKLNRLLDWWIHERTVVIILRWMNISVKVSEEKNKVKEKKSKREIFRNWTGKLKMQQNLMKIKVKLNFYETHYLNFHIWRFA